MQHKRMALRCQGVTQKIVAQIVREALDDNDDAGLSFVVFRCHFYQVLSFYREALHIQSSVSVAIRRILRSKRFVIKRNPKHSTGGYFF